MEVSRGRREPKAVETDREHVVKAFTFVSHSTGRFESIMMTLLQTGTGTGFEFLLPLAIFFAVFYFFLIRPQQRHQQRRKAMLEGLRRGDKVITIGGIHGEITAIHDDIIKLRIAENLEIDMNRSAVGHVKESSGEASQV